MERPGSIAPFVWILAGVSWAASVFLGAHTVARYEFTSGDAGHPPANWPANSEIPRHDGRFTLVLFAHPECPCTRASLQELAILMTRLPGKIDAFVELRRPELTPNEAASTGLWRQASAIPGLSVSLDRDGSETRKFGAEVSGQTMLYDPRGRLVFSGGITAARGHVGENAGAGAVLGAVLGGAAVPYAPVFGCSLRAPGVDELRRDPSWRK